MRKLIFLFALLVQTASSSASVLTFTMDVPYQSQTWAVIITDVIDPPSFGFLLPIGISGGPTLPTENISYDDPGYSSTLLFVSLTDQNGGGISHIERAACTEYDFHCSRGSTAVNGVVLSEPQILFLTVSETLTGPNAAYGPVEIQLTFPDYVIAAPAPEPATWALMLLGFLAVGWLGFVRALKTASANCAS